MIRHTLVAASFLTRLPIKLKTPPSSDEVAASSAYFGLVGAFVGIFQGSIYWITVPLAGHIVAAVLSVLIAVLVTGAFHHDGLADSADALVGGWNPEQRREILKDSTLGTYGVMALVLVVVLEVALVAALDVAVAIGGLTAAHTVSRTASVLLAFTTSERSGSLGQSIGTSGSRASLVGHLAAPLVVLPGVVWLTPASQQRFEALLLPLVTERAGLVLSVVVLLGTLLLTTFGFTYLLGRYALRRIGALTGDILGAVERLSFSFFLLGWVVLHSADLSGSMRLFWD